MKYTIEIQIDLPRSKVIQLFDSTENLMKWQKGLQSFDLISGEAGQEGAQSRLVYQMGGRRIEMTETITKRELPHEFHGVYETKGVKNVMENYFIDTGENTIWKAVSEFQFSAFPMKIMAWLMPSAFKKQTHQTMLDFKNFAEAHVDEE